MFKYVKAAFKNRWNLLALAGAVGAAFISGHPDVILPLVLAGQLAYLGFAATHPKFQNSQKDKTYVEVREFLDDNKVISRQFPQLNLPISQLFESNR